MTQTPRTNTRNADTGTSNAVWEIDDVTGEVIDIDSEYDHDSHPDQR